MIENYRAEVLDKLGLGYDVLRSVRPDVILVSMAAFGKTGTDRDLVGFGPVIELMSGLVSLTGYPDEDEPFKTGLSYGDPVGGVYAAAAVSLALSAAIEPARARTSIWPSAKARPPWPAKPSWRRRSMV